MESLTYNHIIALTQATENRNLEFKETTGQLERSMETLCAFLPCRNTRA